MMRRALGVLACLPMLAAAAPAPIDCINERDIVSDTRPDDFTILFNMRDHEVIRNTLQSRCFGLHNEPGGFTYQPTDIGGQRLCSNQVTIRLNTLQSICQLGAFTRLK